MRIAVGLNELFCETHFRTINNGFLMKLNEIIEKIELKMLGSDVYGVSVT